MKTKIIATTLALFVCMVMVAPALLAADLDLTTNLEQTGDALGVSTDAGDSLPTVIGRIIRIVLGFLGVVMVVIVIYAGFLYMTAGGNTDQVSKAKSWLINSIIGLVIILLAYAITDFVVNGLTDAISGQG